MYTYTWYQWLAFFYVYCFLGWIFESTYVSLKQKRLVNRGFLRLPMLPLYGSGAVMMLWVSLPVRDSLPLVYISGFIAATALEYVTGAVMERLFKVRYWDYSSQPFQLHGYICLSSSIAWGFLTILMTDVIHEPIARTVLAVPPVILLICDFVISVLFTADAYESIKAALALGHTLEAMTKLKADIEKMTGDIEQAQLSGEYEKAARLKYSELPAMEVIMLAIFPPVQLSAVPIIRCPDLSASATSNSIGKSSTSIVIMILGVSLWENNSFIRKKLLFSLEETFVSL